MARKMTEWPSKRGPITKIMPSDGCIGDTVPLAVGKWYDFHEFGWYMGNVGYHYYVGRGVREMPLLDYDPATPTSWGDIKAMVLDAAEQGPVFFKDMAYYVVPALFDDPDFASRITHSFLIRDPIKALLSYYKLDPDFILEEGGLEAEWRLAEWLRETTGEAPLVIEAEAVQHDPEAAIGAYCRRLGLAPVAGVHQWSRDDVPEDWGQVVRLARQGHVARRHRRRHRRGDRRQPGRIRSRRPGRAATNGLPRPP